MQERRIKLRAAQPAAMFYAPKKRLSQEELEGLTLAVKSAFQLTTHYDKITLIFDHYGFRPQLATQVMGVNFPEADLPSYETISHATYRERTSNLSDMSKFKS